MDDFFKEPVHLAQGINLKELLEEKCGEFSIDLDFKKGKEKGSLFSANIDEDLLPDEDDGSDVDDVLKFVEQSAEKNLLSSPEYHSFEQLATKMIDCHPEGFVKLLIIEEGDGPLVPPGAEVTIHYAAYYERSDIPFDTTLTRNKGQPLRIRMGVGKMLNGLELGLTHVKGPTARFHLLLQPAAAWGPKGVLPRIQPEPVLFVISLYDILYVGAASKYNDLPVSEQVKFETTMRTIKDVRAEANDRFKRKKYRQAIDSYHQAILVLSHCQPGNKMEEDEIKDIKVKIYVNLAICYYKINKPKYIIRVCESIDNIIDINKHCKAIFYCGRGYELLGKTDEAISCYKKALKLEPKNKEIGQILAELDKKTEKATINEKVMWRKAFSNEPVVEEKKVIDNVDDDFKNGVADMCQELAGRNEFVKFDLPKGLSKDEINCIKDLTSKFKCLEVLEDGEGKRKSVSIIKKVE